MAARGVIDLGQPLTERIIARLPGPRIAWVAIVALIPWLLYVLPLMFPSAGAQAVHQNAPRAVFAAVVFTGSVLLSLWGVRKLIRDLDVVAPRLSKMLPETGEDPAQHFRGVGNIRAPLALTVAAATVFVTQSVLEEGWFAAISAGIASLVIGVVNWTFFCVYLNVQIGLDRLGRRTLNLDPDVDGRDLGLCPVGKLAFSAFWIMTAGIGPIALLSIGDPVGMAVVLLTFGAGISAFFLSLRRLHVQMVATKRRTLAWARGLYQKALEPVRSGGTVDALRRHADVLLAADALQSRAERIQEWPFDEATFAHVVTIGSLVTAAILAELILSPFPV